MNPAFQHEFDHEAGLQIRKIKLVFIYRKLKEVSTEIKVKKTKVKNFNGKLPSRKLPLP